MTKTPQPALSQCWVSRSQAQGLWTAAPPHYWGTMILLSLALSTETEQMETERQIVKSSVPGSWLHDFPALQPRYTLGTTMFLTGYKDFLELRVFLFKDTAALPASTCFSEVPSLTPGGWDWRTSATSSSLRLSCSHTGWVWRSRSKMLSLLERLS